MPALTPFRARGRCPSRKQRLRQWAKVIRRDIHALWLAARDPRTPWHAKLLVLLVAAYALSFLDLIPDFIPVIGYLDDLIMAPLGVLLVIRLIPDELMEEFRQRAIAAENRPVSRVTAAVFVLIWLVYRTGAVILLQG